MNHEPSQHPRPAAILCVMGLMLCVDQLAKVAARAFLVMGHPVSLLGGTLKLTLIQNGGAFLSLGAGLPGAARFLLFSVGGSAVIFAGFYYLVSRPKLSRRAVLAAACLLGGALSNQVDRFLFKGLVTDFLFLSWGPLHTGIFNLADMAVMFGAAAFFWATWQRANTTPVSVNCEQP